MRNEHVNVHVPAASCNQSTGTIIVFSPLMRHIAFSAFRFVLRDRGSYESRGFQRGNYGREADQFPPMDAEAAAWYISMTMKHQYNLLIIT